MKIENSEKETEDTAVKRFMEHIEKKMVLSNKNAGQILKEGLVIVGTRFSAGNLIGNIDPESFGKHFLLLRLRDEEIPMLISYEQILFIKPL